MPLLCTCQIYMTACAWGSRLIATFISRHSAGTVTAQSMWESCNLYMGVLDSLCVYSADSIYCNKSGNRETHRCREKQTTWHLFLCTHSSKHFGIFQRDSSSTLEKKINKEGVQRLTNWQHHAYILVPDNKGVPRWEAGVMVKHWLGWKVSRQGDSRALEKQGDVVGKQVDSLRGEGDGEELVVAVDLVTQEFL